MVESVLKQMGIQQWRLRQSEPMASIAKDTLVSHDRAGNTAPQTVNVENQARANNDEFDHGQIWSNEPESYLDYGHTGAPLENQPSQNLKSQKAESQPNTINRRPLSEGLGIAAANNKKESPKQDSSVRSLNAEQTPAMPKPMPAPAPVPGLTPVSAPVVDRNIEPTPAMTEPSAEPTENSSEQFDHSSATSHDDSSTLESYTQESSENIYDSFSEKKPAISNNAYQNPIAQLDWQGLQALIDQSSHCQTCSPASSILGSGNANADWMFITDAPAQADLQSHQLFSGRAGQLFEAMLLATGLDREMVYTTGVFKCVAPTDRSLSPNCDILLQRQIELVQPKVIIVFGEFAAQSVLRSNESLETLRTQDTVNPQTRTPVITSYSPTQMLEHPELKAGAWHDLKKCLALMSQA